MEKRKIDIEEVISLLEQGYTRKAEGKNYDHVFINSPLGTVMDHLKGPRKDTGKSSLTDLYGSRTMEKSWSYFKE